MTDLNTGTTISLNQKKLIVESKRFKNKMGKYIHYWLSIPESINYIWTFLLVSFTRRTIMKKDGLENWTRAGHTEGKVVCGDASCNLPMLELMILGVLLIALNSRKLWRDMIAHVL